MALKPVMRAMADKEGFGGGEFEAWLNNIRALPSVLTPVLISRLYAILKRKNIYPGIVSPVVGVMGAVVPTWILWGLVDNNRL